LARKRSASTPDRDPVQVDLLQLPDLIGDVGVDDDLLGLGEQLDQRAQAPAHELEHRHGDVHPPLVAGDLVEQVLLALMTGMALWSSRPEAICWTCVRTRSAPGSGSSRLSCNRRASRSNRLACSSSSRSALGSPARW
jgi:hypothetical protein